MGPSKETRKEQLRDRFAAFEKACKNQGREDAMLSPVELKMLLQDDDDDHI